MQINQLIRLFVLLFIVSLLNYPVLSAENTSTRPKIGIALSGGGARGIAHIGVLQALEKLQVPIDYVAGTSMGSIVGGLYASGLTSKELDNAVNNINWSDILDLDIDRKRLSYREKQNQQRFFSFEFGIANGSLTAPSGFINGEQLFLVLRRLTRGIDLDFSKLPVPFKAVATDLNTAEPYILEKGDLAFALRASMAVPLIFAPVEVDGHLLVDGNILDNLPVDVVKAMGADLVIAVNISAPLEEIQSGSSLLGVARQSLDVALIQNTRRALQEADIVVTPDLEGFSAADFDKGTAMIIKGFEAVMQKAALFKGLAVPEATYKQYQADLKKKVVSPPTAIKPAFIHFTGNERTGKAALQKKLAHLIDRNLVVEDIEDAVNDLVILNDFEQVTYKITQNAQGEQGLLFKVQEKPWGPNYFHVGVNATTSFDDKAEFSVLIHHERPSIGLLGAEWVNELQFGTDYGFFTELYQPLDPHRRFFVAPYVMIGRSFLEIIRQKIRIAEYDLSQMALGVDGGINFSNVAELRVGFLKRHLTADSRVGDSRVLPSGHLEENLFTITFNYDDLDDRVFSSQGTRLAFTGEIHRQAFGAETDYQKGSFFVRRYSPLFPQVTLLTEMRFATFFDSEPPDYESFSAGGFQQLAGYPEGDIGGKNILVLQLGALFNPEFLRSLGASKKRFVGFVHAGNAWDSYKDVRVNEFLIGGVGGIAWDTEFGTVVLGTGYTEDGTINYYLSLGNFF